MTILARILTLVAWAFLAGALLLAIAMFHPRQALLPAAQPWLMLFAGLAATGLGMFLASVRLGSDLVPPGWRGLARPQQAPAMATGPAPFRRADLFGGSGSAGGGLPRGAAPMPQMDAVPCRLELCVPPVPSDSWIGGLPSLPHGMPWPEIDGKPAAFYAQIAAHHLPPGLWGFQGPRSGWLIFFGPLQHHGPGLILHTRVPGEPRALPYGQTFDPGWLATFDEAARRMMGDAGLQPPRWPVRVVPATEPPRPAERDVHPHRLYRAAEAGWRPFDWMTLAAYVDQIIERIEARIAQGARLPKHLAHMADEEALAHAHQRMLVELRPLADLVASLAARGGDDAAQRARIMAALDGLRLPDLDMREGQFHGVRERPLAHLLYQSVYGDLHELRARHLYCTDPAALPAAVREALEPEWQRAAADTHFGLGGSAERFQQDGDAVMLELVPSRLLGWTFGDHSNFAALMRPADLVDGRLDRVRFMDDHGL